MNSLTLQTSLLKFALLFSLAFSGAIYAIEYQVELIIFEHLNNTVSPEGESRLDTENAYPHLINFNTVANENLVLGKEAKIIRGSRNFRLLKHFAWSQEGLDKTEAGYVDLARWVPGIEGNATLYLSRYLHLDILVEKQNTLGYTDILKERRRMRSNETHYFDNPQIGIIARITPLEIPL